MIGEEWLNKLTATQVKLYARQEHLLEEQLKFEQRYFEVSQNPLFQSKDSSLSTSRSQQQLLVTLKTKVKQIAKIVYWTITFQLSQRLERRKIAHLIGQKGLFDPDYYQQNNPEVKDSKLDPLGHYLDIGVFQGKNPMPLFDTAYYLQQYPEIAQSKMNPLHHYLKIGASEGGNPHPLFSSSYYLEKNPEVAQQGINPLVDYVSEGAYQGKAPHPLFNSSYYLEKNPEVAQQGINPLVDYLNGGATKGRDPHPLFDSSYYLEKNPEVAQQGINPLVDYLTGGANKGRDPHPLFDSFYYWKHNPDTAASSLNPLVHYLTYGAREGRLAWSAQRIISHNFNLYTQDNSEVQLLLENCRNNSIIPSSNHKSSIKIGVYCSSIGNYFMGEIADLIAAAFERTGANVIRLSENDHRPKDLDYDVIVAPHEFFYLGNGLSWAEDKAWIAQSIMVNVEQPQTSWFSRSYNFLRQSALVFDINLKSATVLKLIGLPAYFLPLGYLPGYQPFGFYSHRPDLLAVKSVSEKDWNSIKDLNCSFNERKIDLLFIGYLSQRRQEFFAKSAQWLSQYRCFLHIPPLTGPMLQGKGNALTTEAVIGLSQRSKILLNIHQSDLNYFEWHRIVFHGLWQKTLVITEPCHNIPGLIPGEHYIEAHLEDMPAKIEWLLNTSEGQEAANRIRQAGHQVLREHFSFENIINNTLTLLVKS